ncbi:MAG: tRNA preQ1(34) S-adenosylmethionine ribosyltransferase-isomerase QueA [Alphaproteobacteria bacterium]|nr:tRNA preQ1(34) S-adenosylmethionine ribosyltransferase-isomerase QueA [Alphaproteobacteria bacterium]
MTQHSKQHEWLTEDFDFVLPPERIAQTPVTPRDSARLLHVGTTGLADCQVRDLPNLLRHGDLLVMNDTKVIPARLYGKRGAVTVEILLHRKQGAQNWLAFARPGKRLRVGDTVVFATDFAGEILEKKESGEVVLHFTAPEEQIIPLLYKHGEPPLPPYIRREPGTAKQDAAQYQTVYAAREGAVAAPTAGLHFTPELLARLEAKGIQRATVTLHVGAGTFLPVKAERVSDHVMHAEWGEITAETAEAINKARQGSQRIVAVGTTSLRLLESAVDEKGVLHAFVGETDIFITPGYRFRAVDALMTNFHLPKSTLFMLVCAFGGFERMNTAYAHAIAQSYRFYSYGDATLLEKTE